jgi:hypothetical protein
MSKLSMLALSAASPRQQLSPVARKRRKLIDQIELQAKAAEAAIAGNQFAHEVQRWQRVDGHADKQLVTLRKPVRPWWWKNEVGKIMLSLRQGSRIMELAAGKTSIAVGDISGLPETLQTLLEAVAAGELDEQLEKSVPHLRPTKKAKPKA